MASLLHFSAMVQRKLSVIDVQSLNTYELAKMLKEDDILTINMVSEASNRLIELQQKVEHLEGLIYPFGRK